MVQLEFMNKAKSEALIHPYQPCMRSNMGLIGIRIVRRFNIEVMQMHREVKGTALPWS